MTKERALELINLQGEWPFWGNFRRFMTADEIAFINERWEQRPGHFCFADVIYEIARGE